MTADEWNRLYPIGTPVKYYPVAGQADHVKTYTRSEAWELPNGIVVVMVESRTGGVAIAHCVPVKDLTDGWPMPGGVF